MKEIEFRGIRVDNGEMVFGNYFHNFRKGESYNIADFNSNNWYEVIPETVGQYTGLKDNSGTKIFSGDIFKIHGKIFYVEYLDDLCRYVLTNGKGYDTPNCIDLNCDVIYWNKIIGNIHQTPELLQ